MPEEKIEQEIVVVAPAGSSQNQKRKPGFWDYFARTVSVVSVVGGGWGGYAWYKSYIEMKPLYDTFQTKEEAKRFEARADETVKEFKELAKNYQDLTIKNTSALNALTQQLDQRHRDAQAVHKELHDNMVKSNIDIANIKFILNLKNN